MNSCYCYLALVMYLESKPSDQYDTCFTVAGAHGVSSLFFFLIVREPDHRDRRTGHLHTFTREDASLLCFLRSGFPFSSEQRRQLSTAGGRSTPPPSACPSATAAYAPDRRSQVLIGGGRAYETLMIRSSIPPPKKRQGRGKDTWQRGEGNSFSPHAT